MRRFAFDCETWRASGSIGAPRLVSVAWEWEGEDPHLALAADPAWLNTLINALGDAFVLNQNIGFDFGVTLTAARRLFPQRVKELNAAIWKALREKRVGDTMIKAILINIALGDRFDHEVNLGALAQKYLGETIEGKHGPDVWRVRYNELDGVPLADWPDAAVQYALHDPGYALRVWQAMTDFTGQGILPEETTHTAAAVALNRVGTWGVRTDPAYVAALERALREDERVKVERTRANMVGGWLRPNGSRDMKAMRARVASVLGDAAPRTPSGKIGTDRATLEECGRRGAEDLKAWATVGETQTLLRTFVEPLHRGEAVALSPRWWPLVESGRLSCRKPNLTNQPKAQVRLLPDDAAALGVEKAGIRECFVPRSGYLYAAVDYSMAEIRAFAQICLDWFGYSLAAERLRADVDLHSHMGAAIARVSAEEFERLPNKKALRQLGKRANFGLMGGMGPARFVATAEADGVDLTLGGQLGDDPEAVAARIRELWYTETPEARDYHREIGRLIELGEPLHSFREGLVRTTDRFAEAANHFFQNYVARWTKRALVRVVEECDGDGALAGSHVVVVVHDEIIAEVPEAKASAAAQRISAIMVEEAQAMTPDVPIVAEPALMRRWYKGADPVWEGGELVPWEP